MEKVLLVSPSLQENAQFKHVDNSYGLGLAYLHAVLENEGYNIKTLSYNNSDRISSARAIENELIEFEPKYFLVQMFTMNRVECYKAINKAKELFPNIYIIVGGVHASIYPAQLLNNYPLDCVVIGEGEETIIELLKVLSEKKELEGVNGIAYRKNGIAHINTNRQLIQNLDSLPFPKHELFIGNEPKRKMGCILTSRGCPYRCSFCCLHTISKRKFRVRSVKNVVDEVEFITKKFPQIKVLQIADDTFTLDQQRAIEICKEIIRRNIKMSFLCSARIKPSSVELFKVMTEAGFIGIGFGVETGSKKLLKSIHKSITREDIFETFSMLKGLNLNISTYLMVGFPGENTSTVEETIDLIRKLQKIKYFEFAGVAKLWVYPNTEIYDLMCTAKRIDDNYWITDKDVPFYTLEHTEEELDDMIIRITLACTPWQQWIKKIFNELTNPQKTIHKTLPRIKKVMRILLKS